MRLFFVALMLPVVSTVWSQEPDLVGRWDITVRGKSGDFPAWMEVRKSGYSTLVGDFVGQFGSARPISKIEVNGNAFRFSIPPQWEQRESDIVVEGEFSKDQISGHTTDEQARAIPFTGTRAPHLKRPNSPSWGEEIELFNGKNLEGWRPLLPDVNNGWTVRDGLLYNEQPGQNIATTTMFSDFKLHAEFRYPKGSNSGIYLRGRYEVQIEDNYGHEADSHKMGGIYGHLTPSSNAAKQHDQWQTYDIELVGRRITVYLNGERVIDRATIPGITGGALDSHEGEPGPIYLQGDHGPVWFRKLTIVPAK